MKYREKTFTVPTGARDAKDCGDSHWWDKFDKCVQCGTPRPPTTEDQ